MTGLGRAAAGQVARRVNTAAALLQQGLDSVAVTRRIAVRFGLSERHARRYVDRAILHGSVRVPALKVVFTIKVSATLVGRVRRYAQRHKHTISATVEAALEEYLARREEGEVRGGGAAGGS
jgi:hypothetical protein